MRVYHFLTRHFGLQDLEFRRLKIATLSDINDPFELLAVYSRDPDERRAFRHFKRDWGKRFGMLCFSKTWKNPVQWSHYAEKHRGLCLGFDVDDTMLTEVSYSARRLKPDWDAINSSDEAVAHAEVMRWSSTKFEHWQYEDEVRAFLDLETRSEDGFYFRDFAPNLKLREVIVGAMSTISRAEIDALFAPHELTSIDRFKARLAFGAYQVVRQQKPNLWK